jgi:hypothetical protein
MSTTTMDKTFLHSFGSGMFTIKLFETILEFYNNFVHTSFFSTIWYITTCFIIISIFVLVNNMNYNLFIRIQQYIVMFYFRLRYKRIILNKQDPYNNYILNAGTVQAILNKFYDNKYHANYLKITNYNSDFIFVELIKEDEESNSVFVFFIKNNNVFNQVFKGKLPLYKKCNLYSLFSFREIDNISPSPVYGCKDYKNIYMKVQNFIKYKEINPELTILPFLLNGEPGLGKTNILSYLSTFFKDISFYKFNSLLFVGLNKPTITQFFENCLNLEKYCYAPLNIVLLDEVDKYIDNKLEKIVKANQEIEGETKEKFKIVKLTPDENKKELLSEMLSFLEKSSKTLLILCTNNFDEIFKGNELHFEALKKRFIKFNLSKYDKEDITGYLNFVNEQMKGTDLYAEKIPTVHNNLELPIRTINQILLSNSYDFEKTVDELNTHI